MKRFAYLMALVASLTLVAGTTAAIATTSPDDRATHGPGAVTLEQRDGLARPDDRATHGPGTVTIRRTHDVVRPDDRATHGHGAIAVEQRSDVSRPDDRGTHGPGALVLERVPIIAPAGPTVVRADGFDWADAGVGAVAALGLGLIVAGGVVYVLRRTQAPAYS